MINVTPLWRIALEAMLYWGDLCSCPTALVKVHANIAAIFLRVTVKLPTWVSSCVCSYPLYQPTSTNHAEGQLQPKWFLCDSSGLATARLHYTLLRWSWTAELSPPQRLSPQVTTDPSSRIAAKAPLRLAWICCTPLSWSRTAALSPP